MKDLIVNICFSSIQLVVFIEKNTHKKWSSDLSSSRKEISHHSSVIHLSGNELTYLENSGQLVWVQNVCKLRLTTSNEAVKFRRRQTCYFPPILSVLDINNQPCEHWRSLNPCTAPPTVVQFRSIYRAGDRALWWLFAYESMLGTPRLAGWSAYLRVGMRGTRKVLKYRCGRHGATIWTHCCVGGATSIRNTNGHSTCLIWSPVMRSVI